MLLIAPWFFYSHTLLWESKTHSYRQVQSALQQNVFQNIEQTPSGWTLTTLATLIRERPLFARMMDTHPSTHQTRIKHARQERKRAFRLFNCRRQTAWKKCFSVRPGTRTSYLSERRTVSTPVFASVCLRACARTARAARSTHCVRK